MPLFQVVPWHSRVLTSSHSVLIQISSSFASTSLGTAEKDSLGGGFDTIVFEDLSLERNVRIILCGSRGRN